MVHCHRQSNSALSAFGRILILVKCAFVMYDGSFKVTVCSNSTKKSSFKFVMKMQ